MKYNCFIVDDEPLAIDVIRSHLSKLNEFEITGTYTDPVQAFSALKQQEIDLLFLDIEMPELTGLELIRALDHRPDVILTTAYREFAVEGFELHVLDYLVKPIAFGRFMQAIDRFLEKNQQTTTSRNSAEHIIVRADRKNMKIPVEGILYVEGLKDYVRIKLQDQEILTKESLGRFIDHLDPTGFLQIHKSFVVARNKVTAFTQQDVEIGGIELPIGRTFKDQVIKALEGK